MSKGWIVLITLFCATLLTLLLWRSPPSEFSDLMNNESIRPSYPTTFAYNALTKQFDEKGNLSYSLHSKTVNYYDKEIKDKAEVEFEEPRLIVYEAQTQTENHITILTVSADTAEGNEKQDQLTLMGNVILKQRATNGDVTELRTEQLRIQPNRRYAESSKPVIIKSEAGTTSATGLKVFFDDKRIELLSNVKGQYDPQ